MSKITKKDLCEAIADATGLLRVDTMIVIEGFFDAISQSLQSGINIELRGFGRFKIKRRKACIRRNPRTGETVKLEAGYKPVFQASRELKKRVNKEAYTAGTGSAVSGPEAA